MASESLNPLPAAHSELPIYIAQNPDKSMVELLQPYRDYEAHLRGVYAQDRQNPILDDPYLNVVPLFGDNTKHITTRARDLASESDEEKSKYVMPLPDDKRRPHGSPATVADLTEFQKNFNIFSESSLVDMDWSNVVAAGSSVVNCLLPVPRDFDTTKRKLREYYHEKFCPASDVDLFLYGLTHDQAIEKIKKIEQAVKDALLNEVTVVRTKYALTIASQYPVRHVQIVLRVYKSVSEILTGFDIDAAGGAYDGKQVYVTPRALGSFITQINHIDLSRRSPSYENRLSKYSHRNFEVYWPDLDRSRIDPTIYERSFQRTLGLARLLVLERLPTSSARETYFNKRREERGRPTVHSNVHRFGGNIKDHHEDEVSDWLSEEEVSNYHTFTVPYGQHFNAKKIEKLCYTRDLLLNAEWNQPKEREIYLHRHPAFFGRVEDIIEDCCGTCPIPVTPEEKELAEKEAEIYISGKISFLIDNPGRQQIGSFNPLTEQDWTDMAYIGNTARLCQSIVDCDLDDVLNWLSQDQADANQRDYTGRTPLHLAVMTSTPEVVRCLIDHGVRITARLADGKTALHLAASRGSVEMVKMLMDKSVENEEAEHERQAVRRKLAGKDRSDTQMTETSAEEASKDSDEESDMDMIDAPTETDGMSMTTGSFMKVKDGQDREQNYDPVPEESDGEPDYYNVDVLGWDVPCSPLHLAIVEGHEDVIMELCEHGADSILPVKFLNKDDPNDTKATLTLTLALSLPVAKAKSMTKLLLRLGATCSQGDAAGCTALHKFVRDGSLELLETLEANDARGFRTAINHFFFDGPGWRSTARSPLHTAITQGSPIMVLKLLNGGALSQVDYDTWLKSAKVSPHSDRLGSFNQNKSFFNESLEQPLLVAIRIGQIDLALTLLENGADPNSLPHDTLLLIEHEARRRWSTGSTPLDMVQGFLKSLREYKGEQMHETRPRPTRGMDSYLAKLQKGTYTHWMVSQDIARTKETYAQRQKAYKETKEARLRGAPEKKAYIDDIIQSLDKLETELKKRGGKTFAELRPDIKTRANSNRNSWDHDTHMGAEEREPVDYECEFEFNGDREITETRRQGYVDLMEATWRGDLEGIKALTLQAWGPEQEFAPLKMAISDSQLNTPFSIAFHRRKFDLARDILEIVQAQWSPKEEEKLRYRLQTAESDEDDEYDEEDSAEFSDEDGNNPEPRIIAEKADKDFTIDNIGQVSLQVKSHTTPLQVLLRVYHELTVSDDTLARHTGDQSSLFVQCLKSEDTIGLKFLLDAAQHFAGQLAVSEGEDVEEENAKERFTFDDNDFTWAAGNAQPQLLATLIKRTGAGIPLEHLVKKSGIEIKRKPRYYQGLTVYGRKRQVKDWAAAGRNMTIRTSGSHTPPLLLAAINGNQDNVEFFLSDAPHRYYSEFSKSQVGREDVKFKHLNKGPGGFDRAISKWLGADNELVTHCAVLAPPCTESENLLRYLVDACPSATEKRLASGDTPLMVACRLGRPHYMKILIDGNADQSVRNHHGENLLHALLSEVPSAHRLKQCLDLLDPELRTSLFLQRKNLSQNGLTPLHYWVCRAAGAPLENLGELQNRYHRYHYYDPFNRKAYSSETTVLELLQLLLDYSQGGELDMLNGAGDTPLHTAVMYGSASMVRILINANPGLLHRENAVGRTPMEVAHDRLISRRFKYKECWSGDKDRELSYLVHEDPGHYAKDAQDGGTTGTQEQTSAALVKFGLSGTEYDVDDHAAILNALGVWDKNQSSIGKSLTLRVIWDLCLTSARQHPEKRRLVSLNEANDVAKRLGESYTQSRYFSAKPRRDEDDADEDDEDQDAPTDYATSMLAQKLRTAWTVPDHSGQQSGWQMCTVCAAHHE